MSAGTEVTESSSPALQVALAYFEAWTSRDLEQAMTYIAEDVVCDAPAGRIEGAQEYRAFMGPFTQILVEARMIAAFADEETALVIPIRYPAEPDMVPGPAADVSPSTYRLPPEREPVAPIEGVVDSMVAGSGGVFTAAG